MEGSTYGTIYLNDLPYSVPSEQYNQLATLLSKVTFGDFTRDSDMLISSKIWSSWLGGMGARNLREGTDDDHYAFASGFDTMFPNQLGLATKTVEVSGVSYPLGDYKGDMLLADADELYSWNESTDALSSKLDDLADPPVYRGIAFAGEFFIPQSDGFQTWDGSAISAQNTTVKAICFEIWDDKLYAITSDNKLYVSQDGAAWSLEYTMHASLTPKRIKLYMDNSGEAALYISTTTGLYAWDDLSKKVVATRIGGSAMPPHPDNGLAIAHWRPGEDVFYSAGMDIYRFTGNAIAPGMGLNQRDGLPSIYRGKVVDLCEGKNAMYALTQGVQDATPYDPGVEFDPGQNAEPGFEVQLTDARNVVVQWNGMGWHPVDTPTASGAPTWLYVSGAGSEYRLWWGVGSSCYTQRLSRPNLNIRQKIEVTEGEYQTQGVLELGRFDGGMRMFDKVLSHIELEFESVDTDKHGVRIDYRTDRDQSWRWLGNIYQAGLNILPFGFRVEDDGTVFSRGEVCKWIEMKILAGTSDDTVNFCIDHITLKFIKRPLESAAWTYDIQLMTDVNWDRSALTIKQEIEELSTSGEFIRLRHGSNPDRSHRVYMSRSQGHNQTGDDPRGARTVTLAQIVLDGYEGNDFDAPMFVGIAV